MFKIYLLLFSRISHLDDIKKIEQPRVKRNKQPRKTWKRNFISIQVLYSNDGHE